MSICYSSVQEVSKPYTESPCPTQREAAGVWLVYVRKRPHTSQTPAPPRSPAAPQGASHCGRAVWQEVVTALRSGHNLLPNGTAELASCCSSMLIACVARSRFANSGQAAVNKTAAMPLPVGARSLRSSQPFCKQRTSRC